VSEVEPTETINSNGYTFYIGDLKGLWTMYYQGATGTIYRGTDGGSLDPLTFQTELQAHLRDNGIPLLMDSDPTEEVWTWPIYDYSMDWTDDGNTRHVTLTVWTSTDGVSRMRSVLTVKSSIIPMTLHWKGESLFQVSGQDTQLPIIRISAGTRRRSLQIILLAIRM